jgi:hypothetical protein
MHPLEMRMGKPAPPPRRPEEDPCRVDDDYPGFSTFTPCGMHREDGLPWREALAEEIRYFEEQWARGDEDE